MLRTILLTAARSSGVRRLVEINPLTMGMVNRFVAGTTTRDGVRTSAELAARGMHVTLDYLGEDAKDRSTASATAQAYVEMLSQLRDSGLADRAEVSLKLSAVGQAFPADGEKLALDHARTVCEAAAAAGTTVTLDMEDHATTDSTLRVLEDLRVDFPWVGAVLQAYLHRTEGDCRDLATAGSRIRLCKGAYAEPASVAFQDKQQVDRSFVRCLKVLMAGDGYPMVATHDPRMIAIASDLAERHARAATSYEFQMLYGIRPEEQRRLAEQGATSRVYVPYGDEWYGYFIRRLAERPANVGFFLRSLLSHD